MAFKLDIIRVTRGINQETNAVPQGAASAADVNSALTRNPDHIHVIMRNPTEVQVRGLLQYAKLIDNAATTTSVESAIAALW